MSRLDALPADQKSVLQLLLRQGKGYDDLSGLLRLDADEVRSRAYDALDTLGPGRRRPARRAPARDRRLAAGPAGARRGRGHPRLRRRLDGRARVGARRRPRARAARRRPPARAARRGRRDRDAAARRRAEPRAPRPHPLRPAPTAAPRVSRRGGALLIGGVLAAIAVAVVLVIVLSGGNDDKKAASTATQAANTTSTAAQPQVRAQINLTPPKDAPRQEGAGHRPDRRRQRPARRSTPPPRACRRPTRRPPTAIWVYNSPSQAKLVGGFDKTDNKGHLVLQGAAAQGRRHRRATRILVHARDAAATRPTPGTIYLRGSIQSAAGG